MSTPSTSSLYFKCLYADVHVKLSAGVDVAVGQKTATVQMQLDACFNCAPLKPISDFKTSPPVDTTEKKMWDPYRVAGRVELVESISCCSACLTTWLLRKSTRIGNPLPCWCLRLWTGLDSCGRTAHALYPHLHFRVGRRLFFSFSSIGVFT